VKREAVVATYDAAAEGYDERQAADPRTRRRTAVLDRLQLDAVAGAPCVVELGCGTGRLLAQVDAPARIGIDVSAAMLQRACRRGLDVVLADAHELPLRDRSVGGIVAGKGVFRYLEPGPAFAECARVLAPGGVLAFHQYGAGTWSLRGTEPAPPGTWHVDELEDVIAPARRAGLVPRAIHRFRSIRIRPYLLRIPAALDGVAPAKLWNHCVVVLARPG